MQQQNALTRLMARLGQSPADFHKKSRLGQALRSRGVPGTPELQRVLDLPSYRWQDDTTLPEVAAFIRATWGRTPPGPCPEHCVCGGSGDMHLRPIQAAALMAIHDYGGMLGPIKVGGGKTALSFLAGTVTEAERVLLLIPAKLKNKTAREFGLLARHWQAPKQLEIMSYELLSRERGLKELGEYQPDLIVADESQKLKNPRAAVTRRVRRYLNETNPGCGYVDMSGTIMRRSIMEVHHRVNWAISDGHQPLPRQYNEARDWADCIDEKVPKGGRLMPGALYQLCTDEELTQAAKTPQKSAQIQLVRQAYQRKFTGAPGVIATEDGQDIDQALEIFGTGWEVNEEVRKAFGRLREFWELPDGHPIEQPSHLWMAARCLIQGFYYRFDPDPPVEWMAARKEWAQAVREAIKRFRDLDSPMHIARAIDTGDKRLGWAKGPYLRWESIRPIYKPRTVTHWLDDSATQFCANWADARPRGLIWIAETALGRRLQQHHGIPYYASQGLSGKNMVEDERGVCAVSIAANSEGRNLQHFSENLLAAPPPGGATFEQLLGRTHRPGQKADEVTAEVALGCIENWVVFEQARRDARFISDTTGQQQKLCYADIDVMSADDAKRMCQTGDVLWQTTNVDFFSDGDTWTAQERANSALSSAERAAKRKAS